MGKKWKQWQLSFSWTPKSLWMVTATMKLKDACSWKKSYDKPRQHIKKQRHHSANKRPSSQNYGFSSSHVWMWELDCKEIWKPKSWCFWTVVLEKTLESPLGYKANKPVNPKGNQSWIFTEKTDAEAETPIVWPPDAKNWLIGKKTLILGKTEGRRRRWQQRMRLLDGITDSMNMSWLNWTEPEGSEGSISEDTSKISIFVLLKL